MQSLFRCLAMLVALAASSGFSSDAMAVGKCKKSAGVKAYERCLSYMSMAGDPDQRRQADKQKREWNKYKKNRCQYSRSMGEMRCHSSID
jgi:hypothetical protein